MMLNETQLKASVVLQAMVTGLLKSKDDPNFTVTMATYGTVKNKLCYGCCATLALAEMFGEGQLASELMLSNVSPQFNPSHPVYFYLSSVLQFDASNGQDSFPIDLRDLERAVNNTRKGHVSELIEFLTGEVNESFDRRWNLNDHDWEEQLPEIERTIAEMIAAGY